MEWNTLFLFANAVNGTTSIDAFTPTLLVFETDPSIHNQTVTHYRHHNKFSRKKGSITAQRSVEAVLKFCHGFRHHPSLSLDGNFVSREKRYKREQALTPSMCTAVIQLFEFWQTRYGSSLRAYFARSTPLSKIFRNLRHRANLIQVFCPSDNEYYPERVTSKVNDENL